MFAGIIGFNLTYIFSSSLSSLETSGIGIKAQQLTKSRANEINALAYTDIQTYAPETRQLIANTGLYRQTKVDSEISHPDGSKSTAVTVDVFRSIIDTHPIFSLPITLSNKTVQGVPTGTIALWHGAKIPNGWLLCDGTKGTPDLRDKFAVGSGLSYPLNSNGGEAFHILTINEMPSHTHAIASDNTVYGNSSPTLGVGSWLALGKTGSGAYDEKYTLNASGNYPTRGLVAYSGNNVAHENRPPYYALYYIMKS